MDSLEVRKINFNLDGVNFIWNESNPAFSVFVNQLSFWIVALEKYFCKAINQAEPLIQNKSLKAEARLFTQQEAQHSMAHRQHVKGLVKQYPELKNTQMKIIQFYDALFEKENLNYHLAYLAGEAAFAPVFAMYINNRETLFSEGDARVASLCLWHFFEEIEHRSTGLKVYNHIVGSWWYRIKELPGMLRHISQCFAIIADDFTQFIPIEDWGGQHLRPDPLAGISFYSKFKGALGILAAQLPWHNPDNHRVPQWNKHWSESYRNNQDMRQFYGAIQPEKSKP